MRIILALVAFVLGCSDGCEAQRTDGTSGDDSSGPTLYINPSTGGIGVLPVDPSTGGVMIPM